MRREAVGWIVLGVVVALLGLTAWGSYDRLVDLEAHAVDAWRETLVAYGHRATLIERLALAHDDEVVIELQRARQAIARAPHDRLPRSDEVVRFGDAQRALEAVTPKIASITHARSQFNQAALAYNKARRRFPTVLLALAAGLPECPYFDDAPDAEAPD